MYLVSIYIGKLVGKKRFFFSHHEMSKLSTTKRPAMIHELCKNVALLEDTESKVSSTSSKPCNQLLRAEPATVESMEVSLDKNTTRVPLLSKTTPPRMTPVVSLGM